LRSDKEEATKIFRMDARLKTNSALHRRVAESGKRQQHNANVVPGTNSFAAPHDMNQWLNPAAFTTLPVATAIGQTDYSPLGKGPSNFRGPGFHRLDFSLFKQFRLTERFQLEFRSEFFNITNHPNFSNPGFSGNGVVAAPGALNYLNTSNFGKITSTRDGQNDQREIQFALKLYY
jgi:hypothetical protein